MVRLIEVVVARLVVAGVLRETGGDEDVVDGVVRWVLLVRVVGEVDDFVTVVVTMETAGPAESADPADPDGSAGTVLDVSLTGSSDCSQGATESDSREDSAGGSMTGEGSRRGPDCADVGVC
jgi:hypothetical protein